VNNEGGTLTQEDNPRSSPSRRQLLTIAGAAMTTVAFSATLSRTASARAAGSGSGAVAYAESSGGVSLLATGWGGYSNGAIPLDQLSIVDYPGVTAYSYPGALARVYLRPDAARDLLAWLKAFRTNFGTYLRVSEGYRNLDGQEYWWDYYGHNPDYAAEPGTSNHGWGAAVDFVQADMTSANLAWLRSTCASYGFAVYAKENWHFNYTKAYSPVTPAPPEVEPDDDGMRVIAAPNRPTAVIGPGYYRTLPSDEFISAATVLLGEAHVGNERTYDVWKAVALQGQSIRF
jgi:hypothetical protein